MKQIFHNVYIESMAYDIPQERWTSSHIEEQLGSIYKDLHLSQGRLELMTGISSRHLYPTLCRPSQVAGELGNKLLDKSSFAREDIDLLINASVCRDFLEPATAAFVHRILGLSPQCPFFDISNACLGVLQAIFQASILIEQGSISTAMIVSAENSRPLLEQTIQNLLQEYEKKKGNQDWKGMKQLLKKLFSNFTIGSGSFAIILSHKNRLQTKEPILKIAGGIQRVDSQSSDLCTGDGNLEHLMMETDSSLMLERGILLAKNCFEEFCDYFSLRRENFSHFVTHQVGLQHRNLLYQALEIPVEKDYSNFDRLGNCGSVALPIALGELYEKKLKVQQKQIKQDNLALLGIGSGLSTLMMRLEWTQL